MKKDLLYLKKLFSKPFRVTRAGGQTNRNYIVTLMKPFDKLRAGKFFVRLPWERIDMIDRRVEGKNVIALSRTKKLASILPRYHLYILKKQNILSVKSKGFFDVPDGTMVTEYIAGRELNGKLLEKKEIREALVKTLHIFHTSGVHFGNSYDVFRDEIEKYRIAAENFPLPTIMDSNILSRMKRIEAVGKRKFSGNGSISTHNDLEFENLLLGTDGKVYLLDFEYAGFNVRGGISYDFGTLLGDNIFHGQPLTLELFDQIVTLANKIYKLKFDKEKIFYGALADFLVMFWWALAKYFTAETQKEKQYLLSHALQGVRGIKELSRILPK